MMRAFVARAAAAPLACRVARVTFCTLISYSLESYPFDFTVNHIIGTTCDVEPHTKVEASDTEANRITVVYNCRHDSMMILGLRQEPCDRRTFVRRLKDDSIALLYDDGLHA